MNLSQRRQLAVYSRRVEPQPQRLGCRGRPVRTKSRQNESLFRSNGTHVFVLLGFRSDGFSFYWAVARLPTGDSLTGGTARRLALVERGVRRPGKSSTRVSGPRYTQRTAVEYEASRYQWQALCFQSLRDESVPVCVGRRGAGFCIAATAAKESTQSVIESSRRRRRRRR